MAIYESKIVEKEINNIFLEYEYWYKQLINNCCYWDDDIHDMQPISEKGVKHYFEMVKEHTLEQIKKHKIDYSFLKLNLDYAEKYNPKTSIKKEEIFDYCLKDYIFKQSKFGGKKAEVKKYLEYYYTFYIKYYQELVNFINELDADKSLFCNNQTKQHQQTKDKPPLPKYDTIESIFINTDNIQKVIELLIEDETLNEDGGLIKDKYYILAITEALVFKGIIKKDVLKTQRNKLFAKKVNENISDKTARSENKSVTKKDNTIHSELVTDYKELFSSLK